jgi:hypothetical protein
MTSNLKTTHQFVLTDEYIADVQSRSIAQNRALRFIFQTAWSRWIPRALLAGLIIYFQLRRFYLGVAIFGIALALSFWGEWIGRRSLARARRDVRARGSTTVVAISELGIDIDGAHGNSHLNWSAMLKPAIYPEGVLVRFSRLSTIWLPDQALIEGSAADVRKLLSDNVSDPAANGKSRPH